MGHVITEGDVRNNRPRYALAPTFMQDLLGKKLDKSTTCGSPANVDSVVMQA